MPFYLRSACHAQNTPALRTHALLPRIRLRASARCGLLPQSKFGSPSADSVQSPREWVATAQPPGRACTADSGQTKRNGAKHHVQQNHSHRPPRTERRSQNRSEQQEYVVLNIATQESWKNDKGDYENRTEWHRVYAWRNLSNFAKTLQKGQLINLEGTLRYREVEDEIEGTTFKHRIAEIHAISMKRLSKIEAPDDPSDGADDE